MAIKRRLRRRRSDWIIAAAIVISGVMISATIYATSGRDTAPAMGGQPTPASAVTNSAVTDSEVTNSIEVPIPHGCTKEELRVILQQWEELWELDAPEESDQTPFRVHGGVI